MVHTILNHKTLVVLSSNHKVMKVGSYQRHRLQDLNNNLMKYVFSSANASKD